MLISVIYCKCLFVATIGVEPITYSLGNCYSIHLNYVTIVNNYLATGVGIEPTTNTLTACRSTKLSYPI